ncbi:MAG: hypothetical protein M3165_05520 [Actinomycetota bacterium]|nr:hypothetical protein [Actinomycetota bacterium]
MNTLLTAAAVVAAVDPEKVKPGWLALVIVLLMGLATFLLWRSMNRQLDKVHFDDDNRATPSPEQPAADDEHEAPR